MTCARLHAPRLRRFSDSHLSPLLKICIPIRCRVTVSPRLAVKWLHAVLVLSGDVGIIYFSQCLLDMKCDDTMEHRFSDCLNYDINVQVGEIQTGQPEAVCSTPIDRSCPLNMHFNSAPHDLWQDFFVLQPEFSCSESAIRNEEARVCPFAGRGNAASEDRGSDSGKSDAVCTEIDTMATPAIIRPCGDDTACRVDISNNWVCPLHTTQQAQSHAVSLDDADCNSASKSAAGSDTNASPQTHFSVADIADSNSTVTSLAEGLDKSARLLRPASAPNRGRRAPTRTRQQ